MPIRWIALGLLAILISSSGASAVEPGMPFIEQFIDAALRDDTQTTANWSTEEQALLLAFRERRYGAFTNAAGSDITIDSSPSYSVTIGDVDGDGDLDLVVGNFDQQNRLYLNNGTADPWNGVAGTDITADMTSTRSVALGDVDGDGDLDLVAGNLNQTNRLYLNNGTTDPWSGVAGSNITTDTSSTYVIALSDVNGDGDLDLVAGNSGVNRLYINNGTTDPWNGVAGSDLSADANDTRSVTLGDVDGDGDLDLVAGNFAQINRLYLNNGTANPWNGVAGSDITADTNGNLSVALGDVDGDGNLDLVTGTVNETNRLYINNGTLDPWNGVAGSDITADINNTRSVVLGDVDGDGNLDLVAGNLNQANRLYLNNGTADPWNDVAGADLTADATSTRSVALADIDGDGDLDLVAATVNGTNRLYRNDSTLDPWEGVVGSDITADTGDTRSVAVGDVDGDGDLDLVMGNLLEANRLYLNNGTADPWNGVAGNDITTDANVTLSVALGDVDGDGDLDLVTGNLDQPNRLYINNGTANPWNGVVGANLTTDANSTFSVALGDIDGDGDLDLVTGNFDQTNRQYLSNGTADPWNGVAGSDITADTNGTRSLALGDIDGDGDIDLVAGNSNGTDRLYINNGTLDPWSGVAGSDITTDTVGTHSVALGDVDRDGDLDLVAGISNSTDRLYLNNGTANPWNGGAGSDITADMANTHSAILGDVDGDGDLDLVTATVSGTNRLYLNNGTAAPWNGVTGSDITLDSALSYSAAMGDVDGDGDLDLVAGNSVANRLYINNGSADPWNGSAASEITADANATFSVALGDVDGDGDIDLVAGNFLQRNRLYLNNGTLDPWDGVTGTQITTDENQTFSVTLGDVDSDGDLDLVEGNAGANRLYLNNGTADPWNGVAGSDITLDSDSTEQAALGDVDGDGDLDLVAGNYNQANRLYLNNGTADPWSGVSGVDITSDVSFTRAVALGDVDNDGDLDLVEGSDSADQPRLYLNNGTLDPWSGVVGSDITTDKANIKSLALGDVDGDGDLDLVAGNEDVIAINNTPQLRLYLNNGTLAPWNGVAGSDITADTDVTRSVALGDIDGDGDLDLVAGNFDQTNRLYLNNGTADPWNGVVGTDVTTDANKTYALALGDLDGDGDLDIVTGNNNTNLMIVDSPTYDTSRGRATSLNVNSGGPLIGTILLSALGTIDSRTALHFWVSNNGGGHWQLARLGEVSDFPTPGSDLRWRAELRSLSPQLTPHVTQIQIDACPETDTDSDCVSDDVDNCPGVLNIGQEDADGDGVGDACDSCAAYDDVGRFGQTVLAQNTPWNGFISSDVATITLDTRSAALGDVDGDGDLDLVTGNEIQPNRIYLNNGTVDPWNGVAGEFVTADVNDTRSVALGDVDGDGDLDFVAGNFAQTNRLYFNDGTTDPWNGVTGTDITADTNGTFSVALGDVDGDGDLDLVTGTIDETNRLYLNNGTLDPWNGVAGTDISADTDNTRSVALVDVDGDGDLDLVAGNLSQTNRLYLNNGTAAPWSGVVGSDITTDTASTRSVALGDVDGDGDLDLVVGNYQQPNRLYLNNGTSAPWNGVAGIDIAVDTDTTLSVALGDIDGDGALDMAAGNLFETNRLYLSNGTTDPWNGVSGTDISADLNFTYSIALGDVDGDSDPDLVAGNSNRVNRLHLNNGAGRFTWAEPTDVEVVKGMFTNSTSIGAFVVDESVQNFTHFFSDNVTPQPGEGIWYLVRPNCAIGSYSTGSPSEQGNRDLSLLP